MKVLLTDTAVAAALVLCSCGTPEHAVILPRGTTYESAAAAGIVPGYDPFTVRKKDDLMHAKGERLVRIHLGSQRGELLVDGQQALEFPICSGKEDSTPTGTFSVLEKEVRHRSNLYHVDMPYFMRLTYDGIGLHVGDVYRYPVSHGCIRLTREGCIPLYKATPVGTKVEVLRD